MPELTLRGRAVSADRALIMAIINRTPDSFYDRGATFAEEVAQQAIKQAIEDGADVIDIGGVSARPGPEVTVAMEIERVVPTIEWARDQFPDLVISVDTWRHEVAEQACLAGADLINDNWAADDPEIIDVAAQFGAGYVCSHTDGLPARTYPVNRPQFDDVVAAVIDDCTRLAETAVAKGVPREGLMIDPALDFGKNTMHSLRLLRDLRKVVDTGWPVLMAISNKGFIGETLDALIDDRVVGTLACTSIAAYHGTAMFRAHQVRETRQTVEMVATIAGTRPPARHRP
ncbi:dihydropteroate synthase [Fodinicola feengrottensis]|uniref:Dihydropteroate synthase n=1 Tax=Fodinicola feengrottensis TaxID=435914 RepID=A0ABN2IJS6_9ACTN|nr:dihydropteroate synthase [Fodinicola feengrottensis]